MTGETSPARPLTDAQEFERLELIRLIEQAKAKPWADDVPTLADRLIRTGQVRISPPTRRRQVGADD